MESYVSVILFVRLRCTAMQFSPHFLYLSNFCSCFFKRRELVIASPSLSSLGSSKLDLFL